jgi:Sec-independent protein translocase protein TatA
VGSLDPAKILMILVVILIVMGPDRLPKLARQLGAAWHEVTRIRQEVTDEVRSVMPELDLTSIPRIPSVRGTLSGFLTDVGSPAKSGESATPAATDGDDAGGRSAAPAEPAHTELGDFSPAADDPSMN